MTTQSDLNELRMIVRRQDKTAQIHIKNIKDAIQSLVDGNGEHGLMALALVGLEQQAAIEAEHGHG